MKIVIYFDGEWCDIHSYISVKGKVQHHSALVHRDRLALRLLKCFKVFRKHQR